MTMGRRRKHRKDLPERVYFHHGSYFFVGHDGKWTNLGRDFVKAMTRYATLNAASGSQSMNGVIDSFISSVLPKKAPKTQREYLQQLKRLRPVFGHMRPDAVTPQNIYGYMDLRPPVSANRERSLLSQLFKLAIRKGFCADNPCKEVECNEETPRDRYVEDAEFDAVYKIAPASVQCAMDIAVRTGLRISDILGLQLQDVQKDGLYRRTSKTKKWMIYEMIPELRKIIKRARALGTDARGNVRSFALICNNQGQPYTLDGFSTIWQRVMNKAIEDKLIKERFTFHDLRAKAGSESDNAQDLLGHDDPRTTNRVYRRLPRRVTPVSKNKQKTKKKP